MMIVIGTHLIEKIHFDKGLWVAAGIDGRENEFRFVGSTKYQSFNQFMGDLTSHLDHDYRDAVSILKKELADLRDEIDELKQLANRNRPTI